MMEIEKIVEKQFTMDLAPGQVVKIDIGGYWMITDNIRGLPDNDERFMIQAVNLQAGNTLWIPSDGLVEPVLCRLQILAENEEVKNDD